MMNNRQAKVQQIKPYIDMMKNLIRDSEDSLYSALSGYSYHIHVGAMGLLQLMEDLVNGTSPYARMLDQDPEEPDINQEIQKAVTERLVKLGIRQKRKVISMQRPVRTT